ncbi:MAG TPA: tripartite tricarboxylate transporter substrate binding protein, partial [Xanthobacteraceae bacterium]|nr:tripartite tricarboxylate transporter substrate binding protein [Xanthobacteraceae bacterium]
MRSLARNLMAIAASLLVLAPPAQAQTYPSKPIKLIVSIAAGSVTDVIMRAAAAELQPRLGQPVVVENIGGAAGILGGKACAQAAPDGHNVCIIYHSTMSFNPLLFSNLPYNPDTDFIPVGRLFFLVEGLFVSSALNVNSVAELKALAQSKPNALNYATLGEGSYPDLFRNWLNNQWGTKIVGIPYRGGGPAAQALAANNVQLTRFGVGNFIGLVQAGKVKALAVSSAKRSPVLPDVPTFAEVGWGNYPGQGWWGVAVPKGTPPQIVARLNAEFQKLFSEP